MSKENKVRFGLKNAHYAVYDEDTGTYGTPVKIPGAVSLDLSAEGEITKTYADDVTYYQTASNDGYTGSLEMTRFPDSMLEDVWGYTIGDTSKVLIEHANVDPKPFALLFQIAGDVDNEMYAFYSVVAGRPSVASKTTEASKDPQTQSCDLTCSPRADGNVFARTTADTPEATKSGWFSSVFKETT